MSDVTVGLRRHILQDLAEWKKNSTAEGNTWTFWKLGFFWREVSVQKNEFLFADVVNGKKGILGPFGRLELTR